MEKVTQLYHTILNKNLIGEFLSTICRGIVAKSLQNYYQIFREHPNMELFVMRAFCSTFFTSIVIDHFTLEIVCTKLLNPGRS